LREDSRVDANSDERWMREALTVAAEGLDAGELPIGAIVVLGNDIVARAFTQERKQARLLVHADLLALGAADQELGARRREACLFVNLEPCLMCLGAAMTAMVGTVVFGLESPSDGAAEFARRWDADRERDAFHEYRMPEIRGGVLRSKTLDLFDEFLRRGSGGGGVVAWAREIAGLRSQTTS
jgi:tRNA(adenine34) deaminase